MAAAMSPEQEAADMQATRRMAIQSDIIAPAIVEAAKGAPPVTVIALTFWGYPIADVVQFVMLIWAIGLVVQQFYKLGKWIRERLAR